MINWIAFEDRLEKHINDTKIEDYKEFGEKIVDEYHSTVATAINMFGAKPLLVNKQALRDSVINGLTLSLGILTIPKITIPTIHIPRIPAIPGINVPELPQLPTINIPSFAIPIPRIPTISLPALPKIPKISIPAIPSIPEIPMFTIPTVRISSIPRIILPELPAIPRIPKIVLPEIPEINIPDIGIKALKAKLIFSVSFAIGLFQYWTGAKLKVLPVPPGFATVVDNSVTAQALPGSTIPNNNADKRELPRKISKTARNHLRTLVGITTGVTASGTTISVPWNGLN